MGEKIEIDLECPKEDDCFTICYTSGTTNAPKGAVLLHRSAIVSISACFKMDKYNGLSFNQITLSYLPLAHIYERSLCYHFLSNGFAIAIYNGDNLKLIEDIQIVKPTFLGCVPRILTKMYDNIMKGSSDLSKMKKWIFNKAVNSKITNFQANGQIQHYLYDKLVFNTIKEKFGGHLENIFSGSAPLDKNILIFLKIALGCRIAEGYGQTEALAFVTVDEHTNKKIGSIGCPIPCNELTIMSVPEMNYLANASKPQGELCIRGPNVMNRYFQMPKETAEAIDNQGWLHSGDIIEANENGTFNIIDRKKNIFKLSQGEYIAPEKLELIYSRIPLISQIFVYGDSLKNYCVSIIVPELSAIEKLAKENQIQYSKVEDLILDPKIKQLILDEMKLCGKKSNLNSLELIQKIHFTLKPF